MTVIAFPKPKQGITGRRQHAACELVDISAVSTLNASAVPSLAREIAYLPMADREAAILRIVARFKSKIKVRFSLTDDQTVGVGTVAELRIRRELKKQKAGYDRRKQN